MSPMPSNETELFVSCMKPEMMLDWIQQIAKTLKCDPIQVIIAPTFQPFQNKLQNLKVWGQAKKGTSGNPSGRKAEYVEPAFKRLTDALAAAPNKTLPIKEVVSLLSDLGPNQRQYIFHMAKERGVIKTAGHSRKITYTLV